MIAKQEAESPIGTASRGKTGCAYRVSPEKLNLFFFTCASNQIRKNQYEQYDNDVAKPNHKILLGDQVGYKKH